MTVFPTTSELRSHFGATSQLGARVLVDHKKNLKNQSKKKIQKQKRKMYWCEETAQSRALIEYSTLSHSTLSPRGVLYGPPSDSILIETTLNKDLSRV
jgi:hypothetical protein